MRKLLLFIIITISPRLMGQQVIATAGSSFSASSGTISFTIGESVAQTMTSTDKTLTQGFQQPIITVSGISELKNLGFEITAFPNPVSVDLTLKLSNENIRGLQFILCDMNGKLILRKKLDGKITNIPFSHMPSGFYILKVIDGTRELKSFKVVKE